MTRMKNLFHLVYKDVITFYHKQYFHANKKTIF